MGTKYCFSREIKGGEGGERVSLKKTNRNNKEKEIIKQKLEPLNPKQKWGFVSQTLAPYCFSNEYRSLVSLGSF